MEVNFFNSLAVLVFLKTAILIILAFYVIFALMVVRQVDLMNKTLISSVSPTIKILAILHLLAVLVLIVLAWGIL